MFECVCFVTEVTFCSGNFVRIKYKKEYFTTQSRYFKFNLFNQFFRPRNNIAYFSHNYLEFVQWISIILLKTRWLSHVTHENIYLLLIVQISTM